MKLKKWDMILVKWKDSSCLAEWHDADKKYENTDHCFAVGFFQGKDNEGVRLCQCITPKEEPESIDNSYLILKENVVSIEKLKTARRRGDRKPKV